MHSTAWVKKNKLLSDWKPKQRSKTYSIWKRKHGRNISKQPLFSQKKWWKSCSIKKNQWIIIHLVAYGKQISDTNWVKQKLPFYRWCKYQHLEHIIIALRFWNKLSTKDCYISSVIFCRIRFQNALSQRRNHRHNKIRVPSKKEQLP